MKKVEEKKEIVKYPDKIFNLYDYLKYNSNLHLFFGGRSIGKTLAFKYLAINEYIKKKSCSMYMKRYKDDLGDISTFFNNEFLLKTFSDFEFKVDGTKGLIKRKEESKKEFKIFIRFKALSQGQSLKGGEYQDIDYLGFDEIIIEDTQYHHYLRNEYNVLNSVMSTIDRSRNKLKTFCFSNAGLITNPYFKEFNVTYRELLEKGFHTMKRVKINPFTNKKHNIYLHFLNNNDYLYGRLAKEAGTAGVASTDYFTQAFENFFGGGNNNLVVNFSKIEKKKLNTIVYLNGNYYEFYTFDKGIVMKKTNRTIRDVCYTINVLDTDSINVLYSKSLKEKINNCFYNNSLFFATVEDSITFFDNFNP